MCAGRAGGAAAVGGVAHSRPVVGAVPAKVTTNEGDIMGLVDKAKELLGDHADEAKDAVDAAAEKAKELTPDQADGLVDQAADKAKEVIDEA